MTTTDFINELAKYINDNQPESLFTWDIRGEIPEDEADDNKNLIAVLHMLTQQEIIKGNYTYKLELALTGSALIGEYAKIDIINEVAALGNYLIQEAQKLTYADIGGVIIIEASPQLVQTSADGVYINFNIPLEVICQF